MSLLKLESNLDAAAALLVEELIDKLQAGEADVEAFLAAHSEHAVTLRRLLPALRLMADLSNAPEDEGRPFAGDAAPLGELGDFRLVREVGRGGMGVVYEAEQLSLRRRVALKMLPLAAALEPRQLQRFRNEAVAAASLHHAHIIPVYAVGCERGVHFYAMQFIEGCTVAQLIKALQPEGDRLAADAAATQDYRPGGDAPTPPLAVLSTQRSGARGLSYYRRVAELTAQAAEALEHAHGLGIIHRDVKPGNLLVDAAGKLWVGDFGLARLGADAGLTLSGDLLGTLRYMAPEQALARHGLVDHRADVYGLGATLYEMLTLRPAVTATERAEILRQVAFEEPTAPRKLDRAIPVELETVALKCLAKNPAERYATAGELAEDLRRWLADQPIRAKRPSLVQRGRRWARRHRALVGGGAAALLAGLGVALAVLGLKNAELTAANAREYQARMEAEAARETAEQRFALAQGAVDQYLAKVTEDPDLRDKHGLHELRKRLLETAVPFYQKLTQQKPGDDKQEAACGQAYARLADVRSQLGEAEAALRDYEQMRAVFAKLAAEHPQVPGYHQDLARSYNKLGIQLCRVGKPAEAIVQFRAGLQELQPLTAEYPQVAGYRESLAECYGNLGTMLRLVKKWSEAEAAYHAALRDYQQLVAEHPQMARYRKQLALTHNNLGGLQHFLGKWAEARVEYRAALQELGRLAAEHFQVGELRQDRARTHYNLGVLLDELKKPMEAQTEFRAALKEQQRLVAEQPNVPDYRMNLAESHNSLGILLKGLGKRSEAEAEYRAALVLQEKLAADFPRVPDYVVGLGGSYCNFGTLLRDEGQPAQSLAWYGKAITALQQVIGRGRDVSARQFLRNSHVSRAGALSLLGRHVEAVQDLDRAIALDEGPLRPTYRLCRAVALAYSGEDSKATSEVAEVLQSGSADADLLYNAACVFAVLAAMAGDVPVAERYAARAVALLQDAVVRGYQNGAHLRTNPDLARLRARADFQQLVADLEAKQKPAPPAAKD
jgi:serine/threonine protein kinase